jgi:hypothetical protein
MSGVERAQRHSREYWLRRCAGFRVDSPVGELGAVAEVLPPSSRERPSALAITLDVRRSPLVVVGVGDVEAVFPAERRLRLRTVPAHS